MNTILLLVFFIISLPSIKSIEIFKTSILVQPLSEFNEFQHLVFNEPKLSVVLFWHKDGRQIQPGIEGPYEKFAQINQGLVNVFHADCAIIEKGKGGFDIDQFPMCKTRDTLPTILFFKPASGNQGAEQKPYMGEYHVKHMNDYSKNLMPFYGTKIKGVSEFKKFDRVKDFPNKVVVFTNKKETSALYKGVTAEFKDKLLFGEVYYEDKEIIEQFEITEYPTMIVYNSDDTDFYTGQLKYDDIANFLSGYALTKKKSADDVLSEEDQKYDGDLYSDDEEEIKKKKDRKSEKEAKKQAKEDKKREKEQQKEKEERDRKKAEEHQKKKEQEKKDKEQEKKIEVKNLNIANYEKKVFTIDKPVLIHFYKGEKEHNLFQELKKKYKNLFEYFQLDVSVEENSKWCKKELSIKKFPALKFLPMGSVKKERSKIIWDDKIKKEEVENQISESITDTTQSVDNNILNQVIQSSYPEKQVTICLFHDETQLPISYKIVGALAKYKKKFRFLNFKGAPQEVLNNFGVSKTPSVISIFRRDEGQANQNDNPTFDNTNIAVAQHTGGINFDQLIKFLQNWQMEDSSSQLAVEEIKFAIDLKDFCKSTKCFLAILDGSIEQRNYDEDNETKLSQQLEIIKKTKAKFATQSINFGWIDASCHTEILQPFDIYEDALPNFLTYSPKNKQYSKVIGAFDVESLSRFVQKTIKGQVGFNDLSSSLKFQDVEDCEVKHKQTAEKRKKAAEEAEDEDDDIMKEILAERAVQEAEEKEAKRQAKKDKKNKKKKDL